MARIHLDTNVLIGALVSGSPADRLLRYRLLGGDTLGVSAVAWGEFCCGAAGAPGPSPPPTKPTPTTPAVIGKKKIIINPNLPPN